MESLFYICWNWCGCEFFFGHSNSDFLLIARRYSHIYYLNDSNKLAKIRQVLELQVRSPFGVEFEVQAKKDFSFILRAKCGFLFTKQT